MVCVQVRCGPNTGMSFTSADMLSMPKASHMSTIPVVRDEPCRGMLGEVPSVLDGLRPALLECCRRTHTSWGVSVAKQILGLA